MDDFIYANDEYKSDIYQEIETTYTLLKEQHSDSSERKNHTKIYFKAKLHDVEF